MPVGKFFYIRSNLTDMVLTIKDNVVGPESEVCPFECVDGNHQMWYEDKLNGVIRCKSNDNFVLEMTGDGLVINFFMPEEYKQHWRLAGDHIQHTEDDNRCMDIAEACEDEGARVCAFDFDGEDHQLFTFEYVPIARFYIKSMHSGKCIDIEKGKTNPGAKIIMYNKDEDQGPNQLFYEDKYGNIKSSMNDFVFDSSEDGKIRMQPYEPDVSCRQWVKNGKKICNKDDPTKVIEIKSGDTKNGAKVIEWEYSAAEHQHWLFEYIE